MPFASARVNDRTCIFLRCSRSRTLSARQLAYTLRAFPRDWTITQFRMAQITSAIVGVVYERDVELVATAFKKKLESFIQHIGMTLTERLPY